MIKYFIRFSKACINTFLDKSIRINLFSIYLLQFANYIIPFLTIPYVVRVLGPSNFGQITFSLSFLNLFVEFTNFGFNWSGVRDISGVREHYDKLSKEFSSILLAKLILLFISIITICFSILLSNKLFEVKLLLIILIGIIIGNALAPVWLFQGIEKMSYINILNILVRLFSIILIFLLVKEPSDYIIYASILSLQWFIFGLAGLYIGYSIVKVKFLKVSFLSAIEKIKNSFYLFLAQGFHYLYTAANEFILGLLANYREVGIYSGASKIVIVFASLLTPMVQTFFPRFSVITSKFDNNFKSIFYTFIVINLIIGSILTIILFFCAPILVKILLGNKFVESLDVLRILSFLPLIISLPYSLTASVIIPLKRDKNYLLILFVASLFNIILAIILVPIFQAKGMAISYLASETLVSILILCLSIKLIKNKV
ncbi:MAG: oligosaccharide flippase family protein [Candidatus Omnitrophica bacterium]|nr:oligosaccharide flippase family protein [Candidatus Omnitrophota bacterium]